MKKSNIFSVDLQNRKRGNPKPLNVLHLVLPRLHSYVRWKTVHLKIFGFKHLLLTRLSPWTLPVPTSPLLGLRTHTPSPSQQHRSFPCRIKSWVMNCSMASPSNLNRWPRKPPKALQYQCCQCPLRMKISKIKNLIVELSLEMKLLTPQTSEFVNKSRRKCVSQKRLHVPTYF